jgi:hypothetical protein
LGNNPLGYCIPSDSNFDGVQEIVCSSSGQTKIFFSNYTNQNSVLYLLTLDPSNNIAIGQTLSVIASAFDNETDMIYYSGRCSASDSFSADSLSSTFTCAYNSTGIYNMTMRAKDIYHSTYSTLSSLIIVTTTGTSCNNNGICESSLGESNSNCPNDCPVSSENVQTTGGIEINPQLVNPENINEGFLPEIYFAIVNFFSASGYWIIVIFFVILLCLFVLALFGVFTSLIKKAVGSNRR